MYGRRLTDEEEVRAAWQYRAGASMRKVAESFGVSAKCIQYALRRQNVPSRGSGRYRVEATSEAADKIVELYRDYGTPQADIAEALGMSQTVVSRVIRERGIQRPRRQNRDGHGNWKGGRSKDGLGYVLVYADPDDELAWAMRSRAGYVREHRLVMARHLGRPLARHETVHHKDGDKVNNTIDNLELHVGPHSRGATHAHCPTCTCFARADS